MWSHFNIPVMLKGLPYLVHQTMFDISIHIIGILLQDAELDMSDGRKPVYQVAVAVDEEKTNDLRHPVGPW